MNLQSLRCFIAVAEELHFGRAAKRLNMSQPPLSQRIKTLEEELATTLFYRNKRRVQISHSGLALLDQARSLVAQADGLRHIVHRANHAQAGFLRAGFVTSAVFTDVRDAYVKLATGVDGLTMIWQEMNTYDQLENLRDGRIDIAFVHLTQVEGDLEARVIFSEPLMVGVPDIHPLAHEKEVELPQLAGEDFIFPAREAAPAFYDKLIAACYEAGITPTILQQPKTLFAMVSLVSMRTGVSFLPASLANGNFPGVRFLSLRGLDLTVEITVLWNPANQSKVLMRALAALGIETEAPV